MRKKLSCCFLAVCLLLSMVSLPALAAGKLLVRMDAQNESSFKIYQKEGNASVTNGEIICTSTSGARFYMRPKNPVPVSRMDTLIRYRFKAEMDKEVDYIAIRAYGVSEVSTAMTVVSKPKNGEWYEGEFPLYKMKAASNARQFKEGDAIKQVMLDTKNSQGANLKVTCDYIEIFEPDGVDTSPEVFTSEDIGVDYINELNEKISKAAAGDVIEIEDGTYSNCTLAIAAHGAKDKPITIKAKNPGKAIFTGTSTMTISGEYVNVEGLYFKDGMAAVVAKFTSDASNCQMSDCAFVNYNGNDLDFQSKWVFIEGSHNTVENCYFRNKTTPGQMLEVIRKSDEPDYHTVRNNYFGHFKEGPVNGYETVRIGTSTYSLSASRTAMIGNFFERCNGETEIISSKSCENTYTNNTFYDCKGALTLRHGNDCTVNGNLFIGGSETERVTGIGVIGAGNKVFDNYFFNLPTSSTAVAFHAGVPNAALASYGPVEQLDFHNNTFIGGDREIWLGAYYGPSDDPIVNRVIAPEGKVYDNAVLTFKGTQPIIENAAPDHKITFENNIVYGKELGYQGGTPAGVEYKDPAPAMTSDGFFQVEGGIGANLENLKGAPTSPFDVIADWMKRDFYDSGLFTFELVEIDPFNDKNADMSKLLPSKENINVLINDYFISFDVAPQLINDRTMVPMRAIFESLNATVEWDEATASATATREDVTVKITENSASAFVNGNKVTLDSPAIIIDDRFLVPVRFVSESFGATVGWDDASQTVFIALQEIKNDDDIKTGPFPPLYNIPNALTVQAVQQSGDDGAGNSIENTLDGRMTSRWAFQEENAPAFGIFDLGSTHTLNQVMMAFYSGDSRVYTFSIEVSEDGVNYTRVLDNATSSGKTVELETFDLKGAKARYIKLIGSGNSSNKWNNIAEIVFIGKP